MKANEEQITRWIDGELHDYEREEFQAFLKEHPELLSDKEAADHTGDLLRKVLPAEQEPPYADFFNSQIQKQIRNSEMEPAPPADPVRQGILQTISSWFRTPLGALGAAAAAALVTFVAVKSTEPALDPSPSRDDLDSQTFISSIYTPDESVSVDSFFSEEAGAAVMIVEGLEAIPASYEVKGNLAGNFGIDNAVAEGAAWRNLPSDEAIVDWIAVSFNETNEPRRTL